VIVHEEAEEDRGGYWAEVSELPGCYASGDTLDELEKDTKDAIEQHISALVEQGKPVPAGITLEDGIVRRWQIALA
jgi:predicted RNase H-like HicB family nuclease